MAQSISGTREWAVAEINCCIGCPHNCRYCYARIAALEKGLIRSAEQWGRNLVVQEMVDAVQPCYPGQVMFPTAHDIIEDNLEAAVQVISNLLAAGNRVLVVSKPSVSCIEQICERFAGQRDRILFRFTISARESAILSFWEPGAPPYLERLQALERAFSQQFATSVSIEPMLDIGDTPGLVHEIAPFVTHSIWIGTMNRIDERVAMDDEKAAAEVARIRAGQSDVSITALFELLRKNPLIRWKESIKRVVGIELLSESGLDR